MPILDKPCSVRQNMAATAQTILRGSRGETSGVRAGVVGRRRCQGPGRPTFAPDQSPRRTRYMRRDHEPAFLVGMTACRKCAYPV